MSDLPAAQLPRSMKHKGVQEVCSVSTILDLHDMKRKNQHWYSSGKEYNVAVFEVRLIIEAGLRFEVWAPNGLRSRSHSEIEVQWEYFEGDPPST